MKISILIPYFEDDKYFAPLVKSIQAQTFGDFECLIFNNGSGKSSTEYLQNNFPKDARFRLINSDRYLGLEASNILLKEAKGEYIKLFCADDIMLPDCLQKLLSFLDKNNEYSFVFAKSEFIDEEGKFLKRNTFDLSNLRTTEDYFRHIFYNGNFISYPTAMFQKAVLDELGYEIYDRRYRVLNDVKIWINAFIKNHKAKVLDENLVQYRTRENGGNMSSFSAPEKKRRALFEHKMLFKEYLKIDNFELLAKIFPESHSYTEKLDKSSDADLIPFIICKLILDYPHNTEKYIVKMQKDSAVETIFDLMADKKLAEKIEKYFQFTYSDLHELSSKHPSISENVYFYERSGLFWQSVGSNLVTKYIGKIRKKLYKARAKNFSRNISKIF